MKSESFDVFSPDKVVLIDAPVAQLKLYPGETAQYSTRNVVDVQTNRNFMEQSAQGTMVVTTLRVIFTLDADPRTNVSVGYRSVQKIMVGNVELGGGVRGTIVQQDRTLVLVCQEKQRKYRFEFLPRGSRQVFDIVQTLYRAYDTSRAFRVTKSRQLMQNYLLPGEYIERAFRDVALESPLSSQAVPGQLQLTGLRLVWFSQELNLLCPYLDVQSLGISSNTDQKDTGKQQSQQVILNVSSPDGQPGAFVFSLSPFGCSAEELYSAVSSQIAKARQAINYGVSVQAAERQEKRLEGAGINLGREGVEGMGDVGNAGETGKAAAAGREKQRAKEQTKQSVDRAFAYLLDEEKTQDLRVRLVEEFGVAFEEADGVDLRDLI